MKAWVLPRFGMDQLQLVELEQPQPGADEVLVRFAAAVSMCFI